MRIEANSFAVLLILLAMGIAPTMAQTCNLSALEHQHQDQATILRLERAWNVAYLTGDTDFERCLLLPGFTEIMRDGQIHGRAEELALAEKNKGKKLTSMDMPKVTVVLQGNVAVAYGKSTGTDATGKKWDRLYSDSYVWENGGWHVFFAQQTQAETGH